MDPFQPRLLHPPGSAAHVATDETEADSHAQPPRPGKLGANPLDQIFLLRRAQRHEDDVRLCRRERFDDLDDFDVALVKSRRRPVGAGDFELRIFFLQHARGRLGGAEISAQHEDRSSARRGGGAERPDQI